MSNGARILNINGCLERCKEWPKLVIPPKMIVEDVEYFSKHSLYYNFFGLKGFFIVFGELDSEDLGIKRGNGCYVVGKQLLHGHFQLHG